MSNLVNQGIEAIRKGKMIIVVDDEDRENEADLVIAAEAATHENIHFMVRHTGGVLVMPMLEERLKELNLPQMVHCNTEINRTAFTISVDYKHGTTTGISTSDRTASILALIDPKAKPDDFRRPGHLFPLAYREGGVLKRAGHTEASIDLCKLAGCYPAAVISELIDDTTGEPLRGEGLEKFANEHQLPVISVADLVRYRRKREKLVKRVATASIPTDFGPFNAIVFESTIDGIQHLALIKGDIKNQENVLVRVHSECLTGDVFGSRRCDCGNQLQASLKTISEEGKGVVIYLRGHEGRGIGLGHKLRAYSLQEEGHDTVQANIELGLPVDSREYGIGAQMMTDLGLSSIRLMTNNPAKYGGLEGYDLQIVERVPVISEVHSDNADYLKTKQEKLGHLFDPLEFKTALKNVQQGVHPCKK